MRIMPLRSTEMPRRTRGRSNNVDRSVVSPARSHAIEGLERRILMATGTFASPLTINIYSDPGEVPTKASIYASAITVRDLDGPISNVRVTLYGFTHSAPEDVDILLRDPSGKSVILMSDAGSRLSIPDPGVDLTFADDASRDLPEFDQIRDGIYRPTNYDDTEQSQQPFPYPAPEPPYETSLSAFNGDDPTPEEDNVGHWALFVTDDGPFGDDGAINFGWEITITTGGGGPAAPSAPDLQPASDSGSSSTDNITKDRTPTFRGTASAGTEVHLFADGAQIATAPIVGGAYTVTPDLDDGTYSITARAVDAAGTEGAASGELMVTIDTTAPPVPSVPDLTTDSDTGTSDTDNITSDTTPTFTGSAPEAATVTLAANGRQIGTGAANPDGTYSVTVSPALAAGTYQVIAASIDVAGNAGTPSEPLTVRIDAAPPVSQVTQVFVNGPGLTGATTNANTLAFRTQAGVDATYGYAVPAGAQQLKWIPWTGGVNQVAMRFSNDVNGLLQQGDLAIRGVATPTYVPTAFSYDPATRTGVWTFPTVTNDKLRFFLDDAGVGTLDGEWVNNADAYPSGDGTPGGDFDFRVNVLGGDATQDGRVNALDLSFIKQRLNRSATNPGTTGATYSPFADIDANGTINALDLSAARARQNRTAPTGEPLATALLL